MEIWPGFLEAIGNTLTDEVWIIFSNLNLDFALILDDIWATERRLDQILPK